MAREEKYLSCPHCLFLIPITGEGAKTVVKQNKIKVPKAETPKGPSIQDILGDHYDAYWRVAGLFGRTKNFKPSDTATLYMEVLQEGATDGMILTAAARLKAKTSEDKYLPQLVKWLDGRSFLPMNLPPEGINDAPATSNSRLLSRSHAE